MSHQQEQLLKYENLRLYFVHFIPKTHEVDEFYKIGVTSRYDVLERFDREEYYPWTIKVMTAAYGPTLEVLEEETKLHQMYPKNLYIKQKIKGVTEIFMPKDRDTIKQIIDYILQKRSEWYAKRNAISA